MFLLLWLGQGIAPAEANHVMGGEMTYQFLYTSGNYSAYQLTARIYFNSATSYIGEGAVVFVVNSKAPGNPEVFRQLVPRSTSSNVQQPAQGCVPLLNGVTLATYVSTVTVANVPEGLVASFNLRARNAEVINLAAPLNEDVLVSTDLAPASIPNTSPTFSSSPVSLACMGDTTYVLNNRAFDADGDRLSYSFGTPANNGPGRAAIYAPGYSVTQPFGAGGYASVNPATGLMRCLSTRQGSFELAVDVKEYRMINGQEVLLGTTRRDIQIVTRTCMGSNQPPVFTPATLAARSFQVDEGQTLNFSFAATDPERQLLSMNVSSVLLDGPGRIEATVNGNEGNGSPTVPVGSVGFTFAATATGTFHLRTTCGMARATPYDVVVTMIDQGCISTTAVAVFQIMVNRPVGPARISGDSVVCVGSTGTYTAVGAAAGQYQWAVRGGRVLGPTTGRTVQVQWNSEGTAGDLAVNGALPGNCATSAAFKAVAVVPVPVVSGASTYCRAASKGLTYTVAGPPAAYRWTIADGTILSGQGTNSVQIDIPQGRTATLTVGLPSLAACASTIRISLDDRCLAFYNIVTPNDDGQNDRFIIENVERYPNTALTVYNRWGRQVYKTADYHNTYDGQNDSPGVYYYLCQLADGTTYRGWFEIVR
ncbi:T9SS type B sorting domain-containing protein [Hymenobacter daeguensis]